MKGIICRKERIKSLKSQPEKLESFLKFWNTAKYTDNCIIVKRTKDY